MTMRIARNAQASHNFGRARLLRLAYYIVYGLMNNDGETSVLAGCVIVVRVLRLPLRPKGRTEADKLSVTDANVTSQAFQDEVRLQASRPRAEDLEAQNLATRTQRPLGSAGAILHTREVGVSAGTPSGPKPWLYAMYLLTT